MAKVIKVDDYNIRIEIDGQHFLLNKKEASMLAADISLAFFDPKPMKPKRKAVPNNALTRFEIHTETRGLDVEQKLHDIGIKNAEWWPGVGGSGYVSFETRSDRTIDKVNKLLGINLSFDFLGNGHIYYLD